MTSLQLLSLAGLFLLILLDVVVSVALAIRARSFSWSKLGGFTRTLVYHLGGLIAGAVVANGAPTAAAGGGLNLAAIAQPAWIGAAALVALHVVMGDLAPKLRSLEGTASGTSTAKAG